ncbi:hypothetical protein CES87_19060 [Pseudomonas sp. ERMR1:02]|nr:hypothetical protein CES87_19060 [Pseudomonas sp. ERMR1:02]
MRGRLYPLFELGNVGFSVVQVRERNSSFAKPDLATVSLLICFNLIFICKPFALDAAEGIALFS